MIIVHILVEGQTEDEFVQTSLADYLLSKQIYLNSVIVKTKQSIGGASAYRGGMSTYTKIKQDIQNLLHDTSAALITTMFDLYRLPSNFPGFEDDDLKKLQSIQRAEYLEKKLSADINHPRFYPYLGCHEFEALLFSDTDAIAEEMLADTKLAKELSKIVSSFNNPEEINKDNPPSKRLLQLFPEYDKVNHGNSIAIEISIDIMRNKCPHFNEWLQHIENLAPSL